MDKYLRVLQLCELDILKEFVRICEKHNLNYFLMGGTLLGAVRHRGFIPWDDDIDVGMPREDYDCFAHLALAELTPEYFYQSSETDPHYFLTYAKIRKHGTAVYEERFKKSQFHKGVFIDLFPLDFCPAPGLVSHFLFNVLAVMNYCGQVDSGEPYEPYKELIGRIGYTVLRLFSPRGRVLFRRRLLALSGRLSRKHYLASYSGAYGYYKETFPIDWFQEKLPLEFEKMLFWGPKGFDYILRAFYGTRYMDIPSAETTPNHISGLKID